MSPIQAKNHSILKQNSACIFIKLNLPFLFMMCGNDSLVRTNTARVCILYILSRSSTVVVSVLDFTAVPALLICYVNYSLSIGLYW